MAMFSIFWGHPKKKKRDRKKKERKSRNGSVDCNSNDLIIVIGNNKTNNNININISNNNSNRKTKGCIRIAGIRRDLLVIVFISLFSIISIRYWQERCSMLLLYTLIQTNYENENAIYDHDHPPVVDAAQSSLLTEDNNNTEDNIEEYQHQHIIPNIITMTHKYNLLNKNFTSLSNYKNRNNIQYIENDNERENIVYYNNIQKILKYHPNATIQFLTDIDCIEQIRTIIPKHFNTNYTTNHNYYIDVEQFVNYFNSEPLGMFRADLCRAIILYETGGIYYDIDLGIRNNIFNYINTNTEFVTIIGEFNYQYFFQAFIGIIPYHPVMKRHIELFYQYYNNTLYTSYIEEQLMNQSLYGKPLLLGPYLLKLAFDQILNEQQNELLLKQQKHVELKNYNDNNLQNNVMSIQRKLRETAEVQDVVVSDTHEEILSLSNEKSTIITINDNISIGNDINDDYSSTHLYQTSEIWYEMFYYKSYKRNILKHVPYPDETMFQSCKYIVVAINRIHDLISLLILEQKLYITNNNNRYNIHHYRYIMHNTINSIFLNQIKKRWMMEHQQEYQKNEDAISKNNNHHHNYYLSSSCNIPYFNNDEDDLLIIKQQQNNNMDDIVNPKEFVHKLNTHNSNNNNNNNALLPVPMYSHIANSEECPIYSKKVSIIKKMRNWIQFLFFH